MEFEEKLKDQLRKRSTYESNRELVYGLLWSKCSYGLQNVIRSLDDERMHRSKDCHYGKKYRESALQEPQKKLIHESELEKRKLSSSE